MSHIHIIKKKRGQNLSTKFATDERKPIVQNPLPFADKSSLWRVIAPFVTLKKEQKTPIEDEEFSFYLKKKPAVLMRDLSAFMSDSVDLPSLFHETSDVLKNVTKAAGVTLYLVNAATNEIYPSQILHVPERYKVKWKIEEGTIVAAFVATRKEYVMVEDILGDERFPEGIGYEGNAITKSVLCIPVVTPDGHCFGVIELYRLINDKPFSLDDLRISIMVTSWMGVAIHQNQERLALKRQQELNDYLIDLVRCYFGEHVLMEKLITEVIKFAKLTLGAERGSVFIIDQDSDEMVAHLFHESIESDIHNKKSTKVRFGRERGIAGYVARTGVAVNIKDAYNDSRFNKEIDQKTGFITRAILCMPIMGTNGVLGVVQVVNKKNGGSFTITDENLFKTFSLYCSFAIHYANVHSQINKLTHLNNVVRKSLRLQQTPCIHDLRKFIREPKPSIPADFDEFSWYVNDADELMNKAPQYCLYMILQLVDISEVNVRNLMRGILTARKLYRNNMYHNFEHAFNVCHCMYAILKRNLATFSKIEIKALIIAALCHDLDHVGFTNEFLVLTNDDLAQLYEQSILENHHYQVTMMILNENEIYRNFPETKKKMLYEEIKLAILATDLALHFGCRAKLIKLYKEQSFSWADESHRRIVKDIIMTSCDLSGQCKPFLVARNITENVYREFYIQGDLEKKMGLCPISLLDRNKQYCVPEDQVQFLNIIVIPCVQLLLIMLPNTKELYNGAILLRNCWQEVIDVRGKKTWRQDDSIVHKCYFE